MTEDHHKKPAHGQQRAEARRAPSPSPADEGNAAAVIEIARRVRDHAGLAPPDWILAARLRDRMEALRLTSAEDYLRALDGDGENREGILTECLRVGETRFFRHHAHVAALEKIVIPDLCARKQKSKRVRAWSAGAATGQEAYTLAILLAEAMPEAAGWDVRVVATDISEDALAVARAGIYPEAALEHVPDRLRARWFAPAPQKQIAVAPALRHLVRFERQNLVDSPYPHHTDVVLCRNVLIYFDAAQRARTVEKLIESLAPGGYLFLGYAESLRAFVKDGASALECLPGEEGPIYRRPVAAAAQASHAAPTPPAGAPEPEPPRRRKRGVTGPIVTAPGHGAASITVTLDGAHDDAVAIGKRVRAAIAAASAGVIVDLDRADFLADEIAAVLRRASAAARAAGLTFELRATRPGPRRWLTRHGLEDSE